MKTAVLAACLLFSALAIAQSPEAMQYAQHQILLVNPGSGTEAVLPMVLIVDGVQQLQFVPVSRTKEFLDHGAKPIVLADVLGALNRDAERINELQAENDKLWKIAGKEAPPALTPTVVVQQAPPQDNRLERYMLLRSLLAPPIPQRQTLNVNVTDCTRLPALCVGR
jgi:hypothetical protein